MKKEQLEQEKKSLQEAIHNAQKHLKELEAMTPDEDKPVVMSWYTVCVVDGVVHIDQWLDADTKNKAVTLAVDKHGINVGDRMLCSQYPVGGLKVISESTPF